mmetsp:Transcript_14034/g.30379  ORF Transcript_14034/g.30379 Transcript_14034/m.30379 type:complete len:222 (-) Transcript_14034:594-1259(-)
MSTVEGDVDHFQVLEDGKLDVLNVHDRAVDLLAAISVKAIKVRLPPGLHQRNVHVECGCGGVLGLHQGHHAVGGLGQVIAAAAGLRDDALPGEAIGAAREVGLAAVEHVLACDVVVVQEPLAGAGLVDPASKLDMEHCGVRGVEVWPEAIDAIDIEPLGVAGSWCVVERHDAILPCDLQHVDVVENLDTGGVQGHLVTHSLLQAIKVVQGGSDHLDSKLVV